MYGSRNFVALGGMLVLMAGGAALGAGKPKPPPSPPPTYPPARWLHMFAGNGDSSDSRLYMYGGRGSPSSTLSDLWYYEAQSHRWTLVVPVGNSRPGPRREAGWSCGGGLCIMEDGSKGTGLVDETWVYTQATQSWAKASCTGRTPCPSWRTGAAMTYVGSGQHLLFGGIDPGTLTSDYSIHDDTYTFDGFTRTWTRYAPSSKPTPRANAAMTYVPGVGPVLFGGESASYSALCDMFVWTGSRWESVTINGTGLCLFHHSMASLSGKLIVVGGYSQDWVPSHVSYAFTFDSGHRSGSWSTLTPVCINESGGTDTTIYDGARMAFDEVLSRQVFFGGTNENGDMTNNTVECSEP